jgi:hypothetical protein
MRTPALFVLCAFLLTLAYHAQTQAKQSAPVKQLRTEDGGTSELLQGIVIPPKPNAPFTLTLQTEWVRELAGGGTITLVNERHIARDTDGRIYQERFLLIPKNSKRPSPMTTIQIADPNAHTLFNCWFDGHHICGLSTYLETAATVIKEDGPPTGPLPNDIGYATHESLGEQSIDGVQTVGTRESTLYNPGVFGNDEKITTSREYWFSSRLGFNLLSKRSDPRFGTQTFTATNITMAEPDAQLFVLPQGFKVVDHRASAAVPPNKSDETQP